MKSKENERKVNGRRGRGKGRERREIEGREEGRQREGKGRDWRNGGRMSI